jgi:hypothetical protein
MRRKRTFGAMHRGHAMRTISKMRVVNVLRDSQQSPTFQQDRVTRDDREFSGEWRSAFSP